MSTRLRTLTWTAHTCRVSNADVYIGVAPGVEAAMLPELIGGEVVEHPSRTVRITSADSSTIPLRLFAIRDARHVEIERNGGISRIDGFDVCRLVIHADEDSGRADRDEAAAVIHDAPHSPVIAFLVTIGLEPDEEEAFFDRAVAEFLESSWASFPKLLRDVGCVEPSDVKT